MANKKTASTTRSSKGNSRTSSARASTAASSGDTAASKGMKGAQSAVDKVAKDKGWTVYHAQEAQTQQVGGPGGSVITVTPGHYVAHKRDGNTLLEQSGETPEQLAMRIEEMERSRPATGEPAAPSEEALLNSAKATLHMSITAGARPAVDVDLTPAAKKAEAKATRLEAKPPIEQVELDTETQKGIAADREGLGKTTGVGGGA